MAKKGSAWEAEVKRKAQSGISLTNPTKEAQDLYNKYKGGSSTTTKPPVSKPPTSTGSGSSSNVSGKGGNGGYTNNPITNNPTMDAIKNRVNGGKKMYQTSDKNKQMYGNNSSTHIKKQAGDKSWISDQYGKDDKGTYLLKQGDANRKVYMNDANKKYFADNYGGSGGFHYDDKNKVTYKEDTKNMRTDSKYDIYGDVGTNTAEKQALKQQAYDRFKSMSADELADYKTKTDSQLEKNFISTIDGTFKNNEAMKGVAPIAVAPGNTQEMLADLVYNQMGQMNGVGRFEGLDTKSLDERLNQMGLGGMIDINGINNPYVQEQMIMAQAKKDGAEASYDIDPKALMDSIVEAGGLKEGYVYDPQTGNISVDPQYAQYGDILMDRGEATRWGNNIPGLMEQTVRQENVDNQYYETPLELRARYEPESMTEEMKADLKMERDIKAQLSELTLQLQQLEEGEGGLGAPMVLGGGIGGGAGSGGMGTGNGNQQGMGSGMYGAGGDSEFKGIVGGGKGAVYGTAQGQNVDKSLLNAIMRRRG